MNRLAFLPAPGPCGCARCAMRALLLEHALRTDSRFGIGAAS